ncbi:MAG: multicopper oxidase domain-containing protein [Planctomycetaceae bacterium]
MLTRRQFLGASAVAGGALLLPSGLLVRPVLAQAAGPLPGGSLDPTSIDKYVTDLVIPPVMPRSGTRTIRGGTTVDWYELAVRQFGQEIVPGLQTTVWSYGSVAHPETFNYPAFTVEARVGRPVQVTWHNQLVEDGRYLPHLLTVDPTIHWANPPGGASGRDSTPTFASTPPPYTGPVPLVTHLHGAAGVGDESDGYAEAWSLPADAGVPSGYARHGTWYRFFRDKWIELYGTPGNDTWPQDGFAAVYPNEQRAATLWYHDHALGMTRLNVYAGPAGFYLLRGGSGDAARDERDGSLAVLPGPAPRLGDPPGLTYREIPIVIQDRSFDADGSLFYPRSREFFGDVDKDEFEPDTDVPPYWNPEFFGNTMVVNGKTWPRLRVERRRYRFRLLNGCDSRFLVLRFDDPGVHAWQIGNEGGFLREVVRLNAYDPDHEGRATILLGPAERADVIVEFAGASSHVVLTNIGPDQPFNGSLDPAIRADPGTSGQVMRFDVAAGAVREDSTPPWFLRLPWAAGLPAPDRRRKVAIAEAASEFFEDAPVAGLLGTVGSDGLVRTRMWDDAITEDPKVDAVEVWEIFNTTVDAHPIHIHETLFKVVNRQRLRLTAEGDVAQPVRTVGSPHDPRPWESGYKDTVIAYPGQVTRVKLRFPRPGNYVWHCHIVSHEDNEMMRPYRIGPVQPGSPESST